tara:strand:+ start:7356 stop:7664 length:309 start_codon:yes stop_codon:yes gene_type:complete
MTTLGNTLFIRNNAAYVDGTAVRAKHTTYCDKGEVATDTTYELQQHCPNSEFAAALAGMFNASGSILADKWQIVATRERGLTEFERKDWVEMCIAQSEAEHC